MRDPCDENQTLVVVHGMDDAVVADPDAVVVAACQPHSPPWPWLAGELVKSGGDAAPKRIVETAIRPRSIGVKPDLVRRFPAFGYFRTSDHGIATSRSSRA